MFELGKSEEISITLYSILGQVVKKFNDQYFISGVHYITLDLSGIEAGTYLYSFGSQQFSRFGKIIINH